MDSRVKLTFVISVTADVDSDMSLAEIVDNIDIDATSCTEDIEIYDMSVEKYDIEDSK